MVDPFAIRLAPEPQPYKSVADIQAEVAGAQFKKLQMKAALQEQSRSALLNDAIRRHTTIGPNGPSTDTNAVLTDLYTIDPEVGRAYEQDLTARAEAAANRAYAAQKRARDDQDYAMTAIRQAIGSVSDDPSVAPQQYAMAVRQLEARGIPVPDEDREYSADKVKFLKDQLIGPEKIFDAQTKQAGYESNQRVAEINASARENVAGINAEAKNYATDVKASGKGVPFDTSGIVSFIESAGGTTTSTRRSAEKNKSVGGVKDSLHLSGNAVDSVPPSGVSMSQWAKTLKAKYPTHDVINEGDHVHIEPSASEAKGGSNLTAQGEIAARTDPEMKRLKEADTGKALSTANRVIAALDRGMKTGPGSGFRNAVDRAGLALDEFGISALRSEGDEQRVTDYATLNKAAVDSAIEVARALAPVSNTDFAQLLTNNFNASNTVKFNKAAATLYRDAAWLLDKQKDFYIRWGNQNGSLNRTDSQGRTVGQAWKSYSQKWQNDAVARYNRISTGQKDGGTSKAKPAGARGVTGPNGVKYWQLPNGSLVKQ